MEKKICILLILLLPGVVFADEILFLHLKIYKSGNAEISDIKVANNIKNYIYPGDYSAILISSSGEVIDSVDFSVNFLLYSNPPQEVDPEIVTLRLFYNPNIKTLLVKKNNVVLLQQDIDTFLCNNNSECDKFETTLTCLDCSDQKDGICNIAEDGILDSDCVLKNDPDYFKLYSLQKESNDLNYFKLYLLQKESILQKINNILIRFFEKFR